MSKNRTVQTDAQAANDMQPVAILAEKPAAKPVESKADKFRRLRDARMPKLIRLLRQVGNLFVAANYTYTGAEANEIISAVERCTRVWAMNIEGSAPKANDWRA